MVDDRLERDPLPVVTTTELSKRPRAVLDRVARGQRLIVCHRKKPVATLQPLDGYVFQPFSGAVHDVFGWPVGGIDAEIDKLHERERLLLVDCYKDWRIRPASGRYPSFSEALRRLDEMQLRGLVFRGWRGWELTGRGLALREELLRREGRDHQGQDQTLPGSRRDSKIVWT